MKSCVRYKKYQKMDIIITIITAQFSPQTKHTINIYDDDDDNITLQVMIYLCMYVCIVYI